MIHPGNDQEEREATRRGHQALPLSDPITLAGLTCQEASIFSRETYIPCGAAAAAVVWHDKEQRAYVMCAACASHNARNRRGRLLMTTDHTTIPRD
jgi:hypothetical protein